MITKNDDEANEDLKRYMADADRFLDERQTLEDFAKADKRERERKAKPWIDWAYKWLSTGFDVEQVPEIILKSSVFEEWGFTIEEARELVISHLKDSGKLPTSYNYKPDDDD